MFFALREVGIGDDEIRMGGPPVDNVAIDEEGERTLLKLARAVRGIWLGTYVVVAP